MDIWNINDSWYNGYINTCRLAVSDDRYFDTFKSDAAYNIILEHVSYEQGLAYIDEIEKNNAIMSQIDRFKENDTIGGAKVQDYSNRNIGYISPSTLRYVKVLHDLHSLFTDLNNFDICEIGGGYGGQCKIIDVFFKIKSYTIIDLEDVNKLSKFYLNRLGVNTEIQHLTYPVSTDKKYDLIISNYAFSELPIYVQDNYLPILQNCKHGYITFNNESTDSKITHHAGYLQSIIQGSKIVKETPETLHNNVILYW
jgi:putative sugar O-methyltransferase